MIGVEDFNENYFDRLTLFSDFTLDRRNIGSDDLTDIFLKKNLNQIKMKSIAITSEFKWILDDLLSEA